jgi:hypothetical protein
MASNETNDKPDNFVFTAEALQKTPSSMGMATRAIHADDFLSSPRNRAGDTRDCLLQILEKP